MGTTIIKVIGTNIHALRKSHGMTQGELHLGAQMEEWAAFTKAVNGVLEGGN